MQNFKEPLPSYCCEDYWLKDHEVVKTASLSGAYATGPGSDVIGRSPNWQSYCTHQIQISLRGHTHKTVHAQCTDVDTADTSPVTRKRRISGHSQFHYDTISVKAIRDTRQGGNIVWHLVAAKMPVLLTKDTRTPTNRRRAKSGLRADMHWDSCRRIQIIRFMKYTKKKKNKGKEN
jgi:hypothetical protein